jgi:hypothetical protein
VPSTCATLTSALRAIAARTAPRSPRIAASATSEAACADAAFEDLKVGSELLYTLAPDEGPMGPMASSVWTLGSEHPVR